ncbi:MAG: histidine phosphatase family protein [Oscillospiraceae bacterium]|nr:histidine phosphatase family protein [Oscillospiraceae bacterium]
MLLYIIRHGEPDYSTDSLTKNGKEQARALANRLCSHGLDEVYSSPLGRAVETAEPTCRRLGLECIIEEWMNEDKVWDEFTSVDENSERDWAFGCQNTRLIENGFLHGKWYENPVFSTCKSPLECYRRLSAGSDDLTERLGYKRDGHIYRIISPNEKRIAAFCHHGVSTIWLSYLLNIPPQIFWAGFDIHHTAVTILNFRNNPDGLTSPQCMCLADMSHIYKENIPVNAAIQF